MDQRGQLIEAMRSDEQAKVYSAAAGLSENELSDAIAQELKRRVPPADVRIAGAVAGPVEILRDRHGVPHIFAAQTADLFYGFGYAMAQDRLWQMDLLRRRGAGRLAELFGASQLASDITHRTLGFDVMVECEAAALPESTRAVLTPFVNGVNHAIESRGDRLPIEFDLLDYRPEPWRIEDILLALRGFWWQLNGRLAAILTGEAALRHLPPGPLREAFFTPEFNEETIVPGRAPAAAFGADASATGSNNWAAGKGKTRSGSGVLGSDPHLPFALPSSWWECRLSGPEDDVAGAAWAGMPGLWFGRNTRIAWGLTNNNASLRDLYQEEFNAAGQYRDGDEWSPVQERAVEIPVRGGEAHRLVIQSTVRGPIVNHLLTAIDPAGDPPLSLHWVGQRSVDAVGSLVAMNRAQTWSAFRAPLADWALPTFNWVYADAGGSIGFQCASHVPVRGRATRGFRDASNPDDQWKGFIPFDDMPRRDDPAERFVASANNAAAGKDFAAPMYGAFASGDRALRIRQQLTATNTFDIDECRTLQQDTFSPIAARVVPLLLQRLRGVAGAEIALLTTQLGGWNFHYDMDETAPVFFDMFMRVWTKRISIERFPEHLIPYTTGQGIVARSLLENDDLDWFAGDKQSIVVATARQAAVDVVERFGAGPSGWRWGAVHLAHFKHPLSNAVLAEHLDAGPAGVSGGASTLRNTGLGSAPLFGAASGAEYQLLVDLGEEVELRALQNIGQSGEPGSPHYRDQFRRWIDGDYRRVSFDRRDVEAEQTAYARIDPQS